MGRSGGSAEIPVMEVESQDDGRSPPAEEDDAEEDE
jgi:hypothetical protein